MKKKMVSQDKMKLVGTIGSILSVCMYVSYIPQILGNLSGHPGDWIQPLVAFINCTIWVTYGFFKQQRDWPIVIANFPGIVFGLTTALTALHRLFGRRKNRCRVCRQRFFVCAMSAVHADRDGQTALRSPVASCEMRRMRSKGSPSKE